MCWEEEKLLPFMYKLSKCFNTTLKFLNKSGISKTLIEIKAKILAKDEENKIAQIRHRSACGVLTVDRWPGSRPHQNFFSSRNQIFCLTISNHFNLYEETFFGCKTASWYSTAGLNFYTECHIQRRRYLYVYYLHTESI